VSAWELTNITARLVLPPGLFIVLALIGLSLLRSRVRFGAGLVTFSVLALYVFSMPVVSRNLIQSLETPYSDPTRDDSAGAIVILGGGSDRAPEYGGATVAAPTLERVRYGARLQRKTGKPILVSSGDPMHLGVSEAELMKVALHDNTLENAKLTREILSKARIHTVYLVTHAWHMPRAQRAFERAGLRVIPAPMGYKISPRLSVLDFVASAEALKHSYYFFHEVLGSIWYRLRFDLGA
jgi:uncharacterized SAM-binding protein YcdF (DUF218 family)